MTKTTKLHLPLPNLLAHILPIPDLSNDKAMPPVPTRGSDHNALDIGFYGFRPLFQALLASPIIPKVPSIDFPITIGTIKGAIQFTFGAGSMSIDDQKNQVILSLPITTGKIVYSDTIIDYSGASLSVAVGIPSVRLELAIVSANLDVALYVDNINDLPRLSIDKPPANDVLHLLIDLENMLSLPILQYFGSDGFVFPQMPLPAIITDLVRVCPNAMPSRICPTSFRKASGPDSLALVARILATGQHALPDFADSTTQNDNAALIASNAYLLQDVLFPILHDVLINLQQSLPADCFDQIGKTFAAQPKRGAIRLDPFRDLATRPIFAEIKNVLNDLAKYDEHLKIDFTPKFSLAGDILDVSLQVYIEFIKDPTKTKKKKTSITIDIELSGQVVIDTEVTTPPSDATVKLVPKTIKLSVTPSESRHILELEVSILVAMITLAAIAAFIPFLYVLELIFHFFSDHPLSRTVVLRMLFEHFHDLIMKWMKRERRFKQFLREVGKFIKQVEENPTDIANIIAALNNNMGTSLTIDSITPRINIPLAGCHLANARLIAKDDLRVMGQVIPPK
jgi:hypothetical protein